MVKVLVKRLDPKVKLPKYKTSGSSGMDLMAFIKSPIKIRGKIAGILNFQANHCAKIPKIIIPDSSNILRHSCNNCQYIVFFRNHLNNLIAF